MRGLLAELGAAVVQSDAALRRTSADLDSFSLPGASTELLPELDAQWQQLQARIINADWWIQANAHADQACIRLKDNCTTA